MARLYGKRCACARVTGEGRGGKTGPDKMIIDDTAGAAPLHRGRIFVLSLMALFTAGAAVSLRAATAVHMRMDYLDALDKTRAGEMLGTVLGAAFAGFAVTLLLICAVLARIGFGRA